MNKGNYQKTPMGVSFPRIAQESAATAIQKFGKGLPCTVFAVDGQMVTVQFEVNTAFTLPKITIPILGSQWLRTPVQIGDAGMTVACDAYLGGISGQGGGTATLTPRMNLSALAFVHLSQTKWPASPNPNAAWINGPDGAILSDTAMTTSVVADPTAGTVTIKAGGKTWTFSSAGFTMASGMVAEFHDHLYTPGTGTPTDTGPPLQGPGA
jgi:hypothetical protein